MAQFHHVGVPTDVEHPDETYLEGGGVHITDPEASPYNFEYLRFDANSPMPELMKTNPHIAYMVDDLSAAMEGEQVLLEPFEPMANLRVAFVVKDNIVVELMQEV
ncbi:MAG: hypothetical protein AMK72_03860 [Planctomycetes bacterium SM23_25]|nr:MAG: hypothetical protein AMK72_03860 [Planctomycetes bacterium SM23_25]